MPKPLSNAEAQRQYYARMKAAGFKKVSVYVPADMIDRLRNYADRLCKEAEKA